MFNEEKQNEKKPEENKEKKGLEEKVIFVSIGALIFFLAIGQVQLMDLSSKIGNLQATSYVASATTASTVSTAASTSSGSTKFDANTVLKEILPTGIPKVYGSELGVSYSSPVSSLSTLAALDRSINLNPTDLKRYITVAGQISCEYCCGAQSIISSSGQAACGCQHSYAMRGLAKYMISKHGSTVTDKQILDELSKWKILFFPKQMLSKAIEFKKSGKTLDVSDLASNKYRGFKSSVAASSPSSSSANLPNMVGGC